MQDVLDDRQLATLTAVLDAIIPARPEESLPGAGGLKLAEAVAGKFGDSLPELGASLGDLASLVDADDSAPFLEVLQAFDAKNPGFMPGLVFHTYTQYYQDLRVIEVLGIAPRPPFPEGYPLEAGDLSSLDAVRARGRIYREV